MNPGEPPARRPEARFAAAAWLVWLGVAVALTLRPFLWHIDYFKHPGARFYPLFLAAILAAALAAPLYQRMRRSGFWRYEPALLAGASLAALVFYEPRATLATAWIFFTCYAVGRLLRKKLGLQPGGFAEEVSLSAAIGLGALMCVLFAMGLCGWYYAWAFVLLLGLADLLAYREFAGLWLALRGFQRAWSETRQAGGWQGVLLTGFAACFILCGTMVILAPSLTFDVLWTHLPAAETYAAQHSSQPMPLNHYSYFPQGVEVLMTLGYSLGGQAAAQMLPPIFFLLSLLIAIPLARACGAERFSALAGIVFAASIPFLHRTGSVAKNDLTVAFFVLAALDCYLLWRDSGRFGWIRLGVFFLAMGAGAKHTVVFGLVSLGPLYLHATWRQTRRLRAAASLAAVFAVFGLLWQARSFALTGNPFYPLGMHLAVFGPDERPHLDWKSAALRYVRMPWTLHFEGERHFESPSSNPLGIFFVLFAPAWLLARRARANANERACLLFCGLYLLYWAGLVDWPRYAVAPLILLVLLTVRRLMQFYSGSARWVRGSITAAAAYCLLFALPAVMIMEINAPQFRLFARKIDKTGYLREALATFGSLEFLRTSRIGQDQVLALDNCSAAYAPDPRRFDCLLSGGSLDLGEAVLSGLRQRDYRWLVLPRNEVGLSVERRVGAAQPATEVYRDAHFAVFRLGAP
ncbi:MAG: hypothetical protein ABSH05_08505 [Bryobacteraceae bacterium]|jgi:hypothetical protein